MSKVVKITAEQLSAKVREIIKEETERLALRKEAVGGAWSRRRKPVEGEERGITGLYSRLSDTQRKGLASYVYRHYSKYLPPEVQMGNVIDYISKNPNTIPITASKLIDLYRALPALKKGIGAIKDSDIEDTAPEGEDGPNKHLDTKLKDVAADLGGLSNTAISKMQDGAIEKIRKLGPGAAGALAGLGDDGEEEFSSKFDAAASLAADKYLELLKASKGDIDRFFTALKSVGIISGPWEVALLKDAEKIAVDRLGELVLAGNTAKAKQLLLRDINREDGNNVVKTFQNAVSKVIHPSKARGRPRKVS